MDSTTTPVKDIEVWLHRFALAVRERDYDRARGLCDDEVTGFGTVTPRYDGIDELHEGQWQSVWDRTEDFEFDIDTLATWVDGALAVAVSEWSSVGVDPGGARRTRRGRSTIVLAEAEGELRALHTHFSMSPGFTS